MDRRDPLARFREAFDLPAGLIYLDGNSLGPLPHRTRERLRETVSREWGEGLIRSWNHAGWMALPQRVGDKIARLIGAGAGEVIVADSTSVNLFKALSLALGAGGLRRVVLSERGNFPTDLYIARGLIEHLGAAHELVLVDSAEGIESALAERGADVAAVMLTHVNFTTGRIHDMARITAAAHRTGAHVIWDLSHSTGAVPVDLGACEADFAVGCGYKYLNGGPGAPAFLFVAKRHQSLPPPITGWMGHAQPFEFSADYFAAPGIARYLSGTPSVLGLSALEEGVDLMLAAPQAELRAKSTALTSAFMALVDERCRELKLATPRDDALRGSHVSCRHPRSAELMATLIARGVIGDCRPPDLLRFGFAPLFVRYVDVFDAVRILEDAITSPAS